VSLAYVGIRIESPIRFRNRTGIKTMPIHDIAFLDYQINAPRNLSPVPVLYFRISTLSKRLLLLPSVIGEEAQLIILLGPVAGYIRPVLAHGPEAQDPEGRMLRLSCLRIWNPMLGSRDIFVRIRILGSVPLNNGYGCGSVRPKIIWILRIRMRIRNTGTFKSFFKDKKS
jgi:hypothetical protein